MKGNVTIEAAYVIPLCFAAIGMICLLGIYQYNRATMALAAWQSIERMQEKRELGNEALENEIRESMTEYGGRRLIAVKALEIEVKASEGKIMVEAEGKQHWILEIPLRIAVEYPRFHPEKVLRLKREYAGVEITETTGD